MVGAAAGFHRHQDDANPWVAAPLAGLHQWRPSPASPVGGASRPSRSSASSRAWRLGRCLFVGDAGMYSADNLAELSRGLGGYILAVPMRRVRDIEAEVLTRPGRYKQVADNLQVKEVWVGDGERRKRYILCLNPQEAERERARRQQLLVELDAKLALLESREDDHPKAACALMASRRYGRYLSADWRGRPQLDAAKVRAAESSTASSWSSLTTTRCQPRTSPLDTKARGSLSPASVE